MFVELMANIKNEVLNNLFRSTSNLQAFENFLATLPQFLLREEGQPRRRQTATRACAIQSARWPQWVETETAMAPGKYRSIFRFGVHCRKLVATKLAPAAAGKNIRTAAAASHNRALRQGPTASASR